METSGIISYSIFPNSLCQAVAKPAQLLVMLCKYFCVHGPRKQSISKEMNNDNDLKFA